MLRPEGKHCRPGPGAMTFDARFMLMSMSEAFTPAS
jgi:hypothetical protein